MEHARNLRSTSSVQGARKVRCSDIRQHSSHSVINPSPPPSSRGNHDCYVGGGTALLKSLPTQKSMYNMFCEGVGVTWSSSEMKLQP